MDYVFKLQSKIFPKYHFLTRVYYDMCNVLPVFMTHVISRIPPDVHYIDGSIFESPKALYIQREITHFPYAHHQGSSLFTTLDTITSQ